MGEEREILKESIMVGGEALEKAPEIKGIPTGIGGLDELFFQTKVEDGKVKKELLGGIPSYTVFNITGVSDTGKSLMVEQFTVKRASEGEKVIFITVESPSHFVINSIQGRSYAMGVDFNKIKDNIILIDAASYPSLRDNLPTPFLRYEQSRLMPLLQKVKYLPYNRSCHHLFCLSKRSPFYCKLLNHK